MNDVSTLTKTGLVSIQFALNRPTTYALHRSWNTKTFSSSSKQISYCSHFEYINKFELKDKAWSQLGISREGNRFEVTKCDLKTERNKLHCNCEKPRKASGLYESKQGINQVLY